MERNPFGREAAEMRRLAQEAGRTIADRNRGAFDDTAAHASGGNDPVSGEPVQVGLLDFTPLGSFRLT